MTVNEKKKVLYRENPKATLLYIREQKAYYFTVVADGTRIDFEVPTTDMIGADFFAHMDSKLLNRWIA